MTGEPRLDWGSPAAFDLVRAWQPARESLGLGGHPIERFEPQRQAQWP